MNVAILLDGDFSRRLMKKKLGHNPSPGEIETFCRSVVCRDELIVKTYYYDCPPFSEKRALPVSKTDFDFSQSYVHEKAAQFQEDMRRNPFFTYRRGHLSFDGWNLKEDSILDLLRAPRLLADNDFAPILSQKQVDMKIGFDVAKLCIKNIAPRILLATSDTDFIPAIHFAKTYNVEVVLLSDIDFVKRTKGRLLKVFTSHRLV
jgi:uncharacterized LabA/DUF88 family protein